MSKRMKFDALSDSDDLQALFDGIAGASGHKPRLEVIDASLHDENEPDDLQALFDAVADSFGDTGAAPPSAKDTSQDVASDSLAAPSPDGTHDDVTFQKLGQMTRQVHDALRELRCHSAFQPSAEAVPDPRERLSRIAMKLQACVCDGADALRTRWDKAFANELSVEQFKQLAGDTRRFLAATTDDSRATNKKLTEILIAQGLQDPAGQIFRKVVVLAQTLEMQLLDVLIDAAPDGKGPVRKNDGLLSGRVIRRDGLGDAMTSQAKIDDLLKSLGF